MEGNGQSDLIRSLALRRDSETAVIPEDRLGQALLPDATVEDCFLLGNLDLPGFFSRGWIRRKNLRAQLKLALQEWDIRPAEPLLRAGSLSGGNQQKLILAREFARKPKLILAAQPTRGVDLGAIEFIHKKITEAATNGAGVLLVSSDLDEILKLSDRILVMSRGKFVAEFDHRAAAVTETELGLAMGGGGNNQ